MNRQNRTPVARTLVTAILLTGTSHALAQTDGTDEARAAAIEAELAMLDDALNTGDDRRNGALLYQAAIEELIRLGDGLDADWESVWDHVERSPGPGAYQTEAVNRILERGAAALELATEAASRDYVDFGIRNEGMATLLPHLGHLRGLNRLMDLKANRDRANGRMAEAARTMSDMMRIGADAASDELLISSLVGMASVRAGFDALDDSIARGQLDAECARIVLEGLDEGGEDPFRFREVGASELEMLETTVRGLDEPGTELAGFASFWLDENDEDRQMLESLDGPGVEAMLDQVRPGFELGSLILAEEDPDRAAALLEELDSMVEDGSLGPFGRMFLPDYGQVVKAKFENAAAMARYRGILEAIASGADPDDFANAAILYEQAFPYLARISAADQELLEMVRKIVTVTGGCEAIPEPMLDRIRGILEQSAHVLDLLHRASRFRLCVWREATRAERFDRVIPLGTWVRPMRAAVRLLLAEAALSACLAEAGGDPGRTVTSLADALAVALHLGDGSHLLGSAMSAACLSEVADMLESGLKDATITSEQRTLLERRFARLDGGDPVGWESAHRAMIRGPVLETIMHYGLEDPVAAGRLASGWNPERLAAIAFLTERTDPSEAGFEADIPRDGSEGELFRIGDLLEIDDDGALALSAPHQRLIELLQILDTVEPVDITYWRARGVDAVGRIDATMKSTVVPTDDVPTE